MTVAVLAFLRAENNPRLSPSPAKTAPFPGAVVPTLAAELPVGEEGGVSLLFADGAVWVAAPANDGVGGGHLIRVDPATNQVTARIEVSAVPTWVVGGGGLAAGSGSIWVTGSGRVPGTGSGALLQRIDPVAEDVFATIPLDGYAGHDVAVANSGVWALFSLRDGHTRVARIDPRTNQVVATVELDHRWAHRIVPTEAGLLVLEHRTSGGGERAGVFTVIDPATNEVVSSEEPALPGPGWDLKAWGDQVWTDAGGWALARIDPATGRAVGSVRPVLAVSGSEGIAAGEGGIWFVGYNPNSRNQRPMTLNRLNPETGTIDVSAEIGVRGTSIAAGAGAIWLLGSEGTLLRFDLEPAPAHPDPEALRPFVAPLVAGLMEARIEGFGAESFLSSEGLEARSSDTSGLRPLYSPEGLRYESFAIVSVDSLGEGAFEVGVRMFGAHLDGHDEWFTEPLFEETFIVGSGRDPDGQPRLLLVTGARQGLSGS
jgi:hypothetical protein